MSRRVRNIIIGVTVAVVIAVAVLFGVWGIALAQLKNSVVQYKSGVWDETLVWGADVSVSGGRVSYSGAGEYDPDDNALYYTFDVPYGEEFKVLTLTDVHYRNDGWWGNWIYAEYAQNDKTDRDIKELVEETSPDLIIFTGDVQTGSMNDLNYERLVEFMDGLGIPWTMVFGNHDGEHRADKPYVMNILQKSSTCIFRQGPVDLGIESKDIPDIDSQVLSYDSERDPQAGGLGNTVIHLRDPQTREIYYAFILMDSGDWQNMQSNITAKQREAMGKRPFSRVGVGFTNRQIGWYEWVIDSLAGYNAALGKDCPQTALVCHIPFSTADYATILGSYPEWGSRYGASYSNDGRYRNNDLPFHTESGWSRPADKAYIEVDSSSDAYKAMSDADAFAYNGVEKEGYSAISQFWLLADETYRSDYLAGNNPSYPQPLNLRTLLDKIAQGYEIHKNNDLFYRELWSRGSTINVITGHNHCDGYEVTLDGITYTSVVKTGDIYVDKECDMGNRGGSLFTIRGGSGGVQVSSKAYYTRITDYTSKRYVRPVTDDSL